MTPRLKFDNRFLRELPGDPETGPRVREVHGLVLHCLCDGVDAQLFGEQETP